MLTLGPLHNSGRRESGASRSNSVQGRRSGEIIEEEDEDMMEEEEEVEEVEEFSPVKFGEVVLEESPPAEGKLAVSPGPATPKVEQAPLQGGVS